MRKGSKHTPEALQKMSEVHKGNLNFLGHKHTPETKRRISEARIGYKHTLEARQKMSVANRRKRFGKESSCWKGGRMINSRGYVYIRINGEYIREHRFVMGEYLGRPLTSEEVVHHKNGVRADNRLENLELMGSGQHIKYHNADRKQKMSESQKKESNGKS